MTLSEEYIIETEQNYDMQNLHNMVLINPIWFWRIFLDTISNTNISKGRNSSNVIAPEQDYTMQS